LYRLADYLDMADLKPLCFAGFMTFITAANAMVELVHPFAMQHKEVSDALEDFILANWVSI
jgi:hypothetical protein